ncbi:hypothetical protein ACJO15_10515 [Vibrio parahaemolyticus]|uniref:hypothetical protein n=1 Tax=Vibrio parahaemolyticus TaxID=670 RepID=UPI0003FCF3AB|nr:hypothetical protein [Vibrio parahaemolyticus]MBE4469695.1 hypothetical protein [Vibrio parahaemolyticus]MEA5296411.1 hypothetical protein [Vibrio parahaemolyticus]HCG7089335.1 hypothetical protein [Vibrio parahaemolyticus]
MGDKYVAVATLGAAIIAGVISLINLSVSKEHKISELRQGWINELRTEMAILLAKFNHLVNLYICELNLEEKICYWTFYKEHIGLIQEIDELIHKIKLRLNPSEHSRLIALLEDLEISITETDRINDADGIFTLLNQGNEMTKELLKSEWERVKLGEPGFIKLKRLSFISVVVSCLALAYYLT